MKDKSMTDQPIRERYQKILLLIVLSFISSSFIVSSAQAATIKDDLVQTRKEMEQVKQRHGEIAEENKRLTEELRPLQEKLVRAASATQKAESDLTEAEEKLRILAEQIKEKEDTLKKRRKHLASLVNAALALSHTPPEALIMMPGDPKQAMKAARALKMASASIREETQSIGLQMIELEKLKEKVTINRDMLAARQVALDKERRELAAALQERSALQAKLGKQQKEEAAKLAKLAKKADDLQELIAGIEKEEEKQQAAEPKLKEEATAKPKEKGRSFTAARGHMHTPVTGPLVQKFGVAQGKNSTSKGIIISARRGARVVSPYDGEVVFTGPFLAYGQMVILRHSDDFHTLLAGLAKIDVGVGQFLLEGEPIGAMGDSETGNKLYIELRKDNQPVDPAAWIGRLNKKN